MSEQQSPFSLHICMCEAVDCDTDETVWRPCPSSLCDRRSHILIHRIATSARDYHYGGFVAWLRWIVKGIAADEGYE